VQEAAERYRCSIPGCSKMFRGEQWVQKHIENKHAEELETASLQFLERQTYTNYLADADRIQPTSMFPLPDYMPVLSHPLESVLVPPTAPATPSVQQRPVATGVGYRDLDLPPNTLASGFDIDFEKALASFSGAF